MTPKTCRKVYFSVLSYVSNSIFFGVFFKWSSKTPLKRNQTRSLARSSFAIAPWRPSPGAPGETSGRLVWWAFHPHGRWKWRRCTRTTVSVGDGCVFPQCGAPPVVSWFINPHNYSYLRTINHSYWSYLHQLSYRTGAPHCMTVYNCV